MSMRWTRPILAAALITSAIAASLPGNAAPLNDPVQEIPKSLEAKLASASKNNPQVLLAQAKVRQAEAEMKEARLRVVEEVIAAHNGLERQRLMIESRTRSLARTRLLLERGMISGEEIAEQEIALLESKTDLTQLEARLRYLLGIDGSPSSGTFVRDAEATKLAPPTRPEMPGPLAQKLNMRIGDVSFEDSPLTDILQFVSQTTGIAFVLQQEAIGSELDVPEDLLVNVRFDDVSIGGLLLAITDLHPPLTFVARDYGILVTTAFDAEDDWAATIPNVPLSPEAVPAPGAGSAR